MTTNTGIAGLLARLERRRDEAAAVGATAPVERVVGVFIEELRELNLPSNSNGGQPAPDRMLTAREVAKRLGISVRTVYKSAAGWPFTRRYPSGSVRFSEIGLDTWLERRR